MLSRLKLANIVGGKYLKVRTESTLVTIQINTVYDTKKPIMKKNMIQVSEMVVSIDTLKIDQVKRSERK